MLGVVELKANCVLALQLTIFITAQSFYAAAQGRTDATLGLCGRMRCNKNKKAANVVAHVMANHVKAAVSLYFLFLSSGESC